MLISFSIGGGNYWQLFVSISDYFALYCQQRSAKKSKKGGDDSDDDMGTPASGKKRKGGNHRVSRFQYFSVGIVIDVFVLRFHLQIVLLVFSSLWNKCLGTAVLSRGSYKKSKKSKKDESESDEDEDDGDDSE